MRTFVFILWTFLVFSNSVAAQFTEKEFDVDLWTNGLPNTNGIDRTPFDDNIQNYKPSLRVFYPRRRKRPDVPLLLVPVGLTEVWLMDMKDMSGHLSLIN